MLIHIERLFDRLPHDVRLSHLHFGGGSPNTLSVQDLGLMMDRILARFDVNADAEIAIELDPRTTSREFATALGGLGFNRASLGVQAFAKPVQEAINRVQPFSAVAANVDHLRAGGVDNINFDLMYGLPLQTTQMVRDDARKALALGPSRLAIFGYAHVPWFAKAQRMIKDADLPDADARLAQALAARAVMAEHGMVSVGIDHFATPDDSLAIALRTGTMRRNFQGYTTDQADWLLALGPSGISATPFGYAQNHAATHAWQLALTDQGNLPIAKVLPTTADQIETRHHINQILCDGRLDLSDAQMAQSSLMARLQQLEQAGMVRLDGPALRLTEAGQIYGRVVAGAFDPLEDWQFGQINPRQATVI